MARAQVWQLAVELESAWQLEWLLEMEWAMASGSPPELEASALMLGESREWPWARVQGLPPGWALGPMLLVPLRQAEELA